MASDVILHGFLLGLGFWAAAGLLRGVAWVLLRLLDKAEGAFK